MFEKLIDKYKKYVYYNINNITIIASIIVLTGGVVFNIKNIAKDDEEDTQVSIKESFYKNKKETVERITHKKERNFTLPKLKSKFDKQKESQKKFKISYPKKEKFTKTQTNPTSKVKNNHFKKTRVTKREEEQSNNHSINVVATAYTAFCSTGCIGKTRTGYDVSNTSYYRGKRIIAVDPSLIPLNSLVEVSYKGGSFQAYAIDTGGDIKSNRIDILMNTKSEAKTFGRQQASVKMLENDW
ncbi:3D domain-containing protein [Bacillus sp. HU-1818]|uniref:3D domain-containing protein n=1 Tax=Bacillus sp. HU-1818 TaxID=2704469 RepID=UPI001F5D3FDA|nr:3D domain-containing protein [Bacillus sp. HU-1818]